MNWLDKQARYFTKQDKETYDEIRALLPKIPEDACGSCGPHSYPAMRRFLKEANPIRMLEIGFNVGLSSMFWVTRKHVSPLDLYSVDIKVRHEFEKAVYDEARQRGISFYLTESDSRNLASLDLGAPCDSAFIDGDHSYEGIRSDIAACRSKGVVHFLFDDWLPEYGETQKAIEESGLRLVWVMGNMAYCKDDAHEMGSWK